MSIGLKPVLETKRRNLNFAVMLKNDMNHFLSFTHAPTAMHTLRFQNACGIKQTLTVN